ncbi:transposable element Tcb2 transposase [Trichonephila clavipes]|nr:transposable element Tcb2 transposase [Trichonephila clavipes]
MATQRYVHDILQPHVLPLMQRLPGAILQQDNARPHTARVSQDYLRSVSTLPWPTRSPNLSPIEHIWDLFGRRVRYPTSLNEIESRPCLKTAIASFTLETTSVCTTNDVMNGGHGQRNGTT